MHDDKMTLSATATGRTITITQVDALTIHEFLATCRSLALAMDYQLESWNDAIIAAAEEIKEEEIQTQVNRYESHLRECDC